MVRVKLVKDKTWSSEKNDYVYTEEGEFVGKEYEAFETNSIQDGKNCKRYFLDFGDGCYIADEVQVEVLDASLDYSNEEGVLKSIRENVEMQSPQWTVVKAQPKKVLLVEDGSVDIDDLEEWCDNQNFKLIVYRSGANKPEIIEI